MNQVAALLLGLVLGAFAGAMLGGNSGYANACRQAGNLIVTVEDAPHCVSPERAAKIEAAKKAAKEALR